MITREEVRIERASEPAAPGDGGRLSCCHHWLSSVARREGSQPAGRRVRRALPGKAVFKGPLGPWQLAVGVDAGPAGGTARFLGTGSRWREGQVGGAR